MGNHKRNRKKSKAGLAAVPSTSLPGTGNVDSRKAKSNNGPSPATGMLNQGYDHSDGQLDLLRVKYALLGKAEWWWIFEDSLQVLGSKLQRDNFAVVDNFLGPEKATGLHQELVNAYRAGRLPETQHEMVGCPRLEPGALAGGTTGENLTYRMKSVRGDYVAWFNGKEAGCHWKILPVYLQRLDTFVNELSAVVKELEGTTAFRSNAMCTCYPGKGAHYVRHCDNTASTKNGRKLTALFYANPSWVQGDGGELRLFKTKHEGEVVAFKHVRDVEPIMDRMVVFFSDERVPHEVLPSNATRFAVTVWYFDKEEKLKANARKESNVTQADAQEERRIQAEIDRFQKEYGEVAEIVNEGKVSQSTVNSAVQPQAPSHTVATIPAPPVTMSAPYSSQGYGEDSATDSDDCIPGPQQRAVAQRRALVPGGSTSGLETELAQASLDDSRCESKSCGG